MKVNIGDSIASEFGKGQIVAITEEWIVYRAEDGCEYAISISDSAFWIPAEIGEKGTMKTSADINF